MLDDSSMMFPETAHFSGRVVHNYYDYSYDNPYSVPKNFHLEIPLLQAKLMQQHRKD